MMIAQRVLSLLEARMTAAEFRRLQDEYAKRGFQLVRKGRGRNQQFIVSTLLAVRPGEAQFVKFATRNPADIRDVDKVTSDLQKFATDAEKEREYRSKFGQMADKLKARVAYWKELLRKNKSKVYPSEKDSNLDLLAKALAITDDPDWLFDSYRELVAAALGERGGKSGSFDVEDEREMLMGVIKRKLRSL